jgi:hypothetical protein
MCCFWSFFALLCRVIFSHITYMRVLLCSLLRFLQTNLEQGWVLLLSVFLSSLLLLCCYSSASLTLLWLFSWICGPRPRGSRVCVFYEAVMFVLLLSFGVLWFLSGEVCRAGVLSCDLVFVVRYIKLLSCASVFSVFYLLLVIVIIIYCIKYRLFFMK